MIGNPIGYPIGGVIVVSTTRLTADVGTFTLTGIPVTFRVIQANTVGNYALTGQDATCKVIQSCLVGSYSLTGQSTGYIIRMACEPGAFVLTGNNTGLAYVEAPAEAVPGGGEDRKRRKRRKVVKAPPKKKPGKRKQPPPVPRPEADRPPVALPAARPVFLPPPLTRRELRARELADLRDAWALLGAVADPEAPMLREMAGEALDIEDALAAIAALEAVDPDEEDIEAAMVALTMVPDPAMVEAQDLIDLNRL